MTNPDWLPHILGGMFVLITGSYAFTWKIFNKLSTRVNAVLKNHVTHLEDRMRNVEDRISNLEK